MIFEKATEKDIPQLLELIESCYRSDFARKGWTYDSDIIGGARTTKEFVKEEIIAPGGSYLKHTDVQGKVIACVYIKVNTQEKKAFVGSLCVYPTFQSHGLGKGLLDATEIIAREAGCSKLCVQIVTMRKELINWFEKIDFKFVGELAPLTADTGTPKIPIELGTWEKVLG